MKQNDTVHCKKPAIRLVAVTIDRILHHYGPEELSAFGALGCFEERTPTQLYEEMKKTKKPEEIELKKEKILENSAGKGHGAVTDPNSFIFEIEDLTRAATLQLCQPQYLSHLQQSLRRASATRGYYLPEVIFASGNAEMTRATLDAAFKLYEEMTAAGVPNEDARYILPLYVRTNIQTTGDARELTHLFGMNGQGLVPSAAKYVVEEMIRQASAVAPKLFKRRESNYETLEWYPAAQLYAEKNRTMERIISSTEHRNQTQFITYKIEAETVMRAVAERDEAELANLKHIHNGNAIEGFLAPLSLAAFHQAIRQRTWDQSVESIFHAVERASYQTPRTILNSEFAERYEKQMHAMHELYQHLLVDGVPKSEAIGVIAHALVVYDLIHINGWNSIRGIGKRTCTETQWEIREAANDMAKYLKCVNPALGSVIAPQGDVYGRCPERKPCGLCRKASNIPKKENA